MKNKRLIQKVYFYLLLLSMLSTIVNAQDTVERENDHRNSTSVYFNVGFGKAMNIYKDRGRSAALFANFAVEKYMLSVRALGNMEYTLDEGPTPVETYSDLSLLLGYKLFGNDHRSIIPMIGAGKISSTKRGVLLDEFSVDAKHEKIRERDLGLTLGLKFQTNSKHVAYSIYVFSNSNRMQSYYGVLLCLGFGKMY